MCCAQTPERVLPSTPCRRIASRRIASGRSTFVPRSVSGCTGFSSAFSKLDKAGVGYLRLRHLRAWLTSAASSSKSAHLSPDLQSGNGARSSSGGDDDHLARGSGLSSYYSPLLLTKLLDAYLFRIQSRFLVRREVAAAADDAAAAADEDADGGGKRGSQLRSQSDAAAAGGSGGAEGSANQQQQQQQQPSSRPSSPSPDADDDDNASGMSSTGGGATVRS